MTERYFKMKCTFDTLPILPLKLCIPLSPFFIRFLLFGTCSIRGTGTFNQRYLMGFRLGYYHQNNDKFVLHA